MFTAFLCGDVRHTHVCICARQVPVVECSLFHDSKQCQLSSNCVACEIRGCMDKVLFQFISKTRRSFQHGSFSKDSNAFKTTVTGPPLTLFLSLSFV